MLRVLLAILQPGYWLASILSTVFLNINFPPYKENFVLRLFARCGYKPLARFLNYDEEYSLVYYGAQRGTLLHFPACGGTAIPCTMLLSPLELAEHHASLRYENKGTLFQLPPALLDQTDEGFRAFTKKLSEYGARSYNFINARLIAVRRAPGVVTLVLESVPYTCYMRTNLCLDYVSATTPHSLRARLHPEGRLDDIGESRLANNLGINVILMTPGGQVIIQKRSMAVVVRPGELAPTFSGTVEPGDLVYGDGPWSQFQVLREGTEELGITEDDLRTFKDGTCFKFLGLTRELVRGGQAELFAFGFTRASADDLRQTRLTARDQFESQQLVFYPLIDPMIADRDLRLADFRCNVEGLVREHGKHLSLPLKTGLALLDAHWDLWQDEAPGADARGAAAKSG